MEEKILEWFENKLINPYTKRKIKENGATYKKLMKLYNKFILDKNIINESNNNLSPLDSIEDVDIISLNKIWEIKDGVKVLVHENTNELITYKDINNNIHCLEKESIQYLKDYKIDIHPITKVKIPQYVFDSVNITIIKKEKSVDELALDMVQLLTHQSYFIDKNHIINLNECSINKLYYECYSFFEANLPKSKIQQIRNNSEIFKINPKYFGNYKTKCEERFKYLLKSFINLLEYDDDMIKIIACHIIMGGLSIVNKDIKKLYPDFNYDFN
jgi:hypothetical protein